MTKTKDTSGAGFWPEGFWSGFAGAAQRSHERRATKERAEKYGHPYVKCVECGAKTHPGRVVTVNLLSTCLTCAESANEYTESAGF
jgi:RNA polymerase-binding transcription factor DksA